MAVAVKNTPAADSASVFDRLTVGMLAGVLYVAGCLAVVGKLLPTLWWSYFSETFVTWALLGTLLVLVSAALVFLGVRLMGPHPAHGLKAGVFVGLVSLLSVLLLARWASLWFEHWAYQGLLDPKVAIALTVAVFVALLVGTIYLLSRPRTHQRIITFEDQGWFSTTAFKRSQGQIVRRGTIVGIVMLLGCGIYTLLEHKTLDTASRNWALDVPFTGKVTVKDPGDFAKQLDDQVTEELVTDRGDSNLVTGRMVPKDKYKAEVEQTRSAGKTPPQGMPVMDRFAFHQFQQNATQNYVKITNLGDLPANKYAEGDVIAKPEFETEREKLVKLKDQGKEPPEATAPAVPTGPAEYATLTLLPNVKYTLPILLVFASIWLAYRVVNLPVFADFLIATEAELNKVSWTSRSRLFQDTLVVLTTVLLMTIGLLVVDLVWTRVLSWRVVGVLQLDRAAGGPGSTGDREKPW